MSNDHHSTPLPITRSANRDPIWIPPAASSASRRPPLRSRGAFTGTLVDPITNRVLVVESMLEEGWASILRTHQATKEVFDQPPAIDYIDNEERQRSHTFDFLAVLHGGRRIAYAVKPCAKVASSGIERTLELIRRQVRPGFADAFVLRTEQHITRDRVYNARLILHSWASRNPEHVAAVDRIVRKHRGSVLVRDIADASGLEGHALRAIACLIGDGVLSLTRPCRINHAAFVTPALRAH